MDSSDEDRWAHARCLLGYVASTDRKPLTRTALESSRRARTHFPAHLNFPLKRRARDPGAANAQLLGSVPAILMQQPVASAQARRCNVVERDDEPRPMKARRVEGDIGPARPIRDEIHEAVVHRIGTGVRRRKQRVDIELVDARLEVRDFARTPWQLLEYERVASRTTRHDGFALPGNQRIATRAADEGAAHDLRGQRLPWAARRRRRGWRG